MENLNNSNFWGYDMSMIPSNDIRNYLYIYIRESTFITPRGGGGDEDLCHEKRSYFYRAPVEVIVNLVNFRCHPQVLKIFNAAPPPQNPESKEYNPEFSLIAGTTCTSLRCLIYSSMCNKNTDLLLLSPHYRQMK